MGNIWMDTNKRRLDKIKRQLLEYNFAGSYGGAINLPEIISLIDGLTVEILKLQKENDELKKKVK